MTRAELLYQVKMLSLILMWMSIPFTLVAVVTWDLDMALLAAGELICGMIGWGAMTKWEEENDV